MLIYGYFVAICGYFAAISCLLPHPYSFHTVSLPVLVSDTNDKWLACGRTAAVVAGAYCLSSNHAGAADKMQFGSAGWIIDPDGVVLATMDVEQRFVTVGIDLGRAVAAKSNTPRFVHDSPLRPPLSVDNLPPALLT